MGPSVKNVFIFWRNILIFDHYTRYRFVFCAKAIYKSQAKIGETKGRSLNVTTGICEK